MSQNPLCPVTPWRQEGVVKARCRGLKFQNMLLGHVPRPSFLRAGLSWLEGAVRPQISREGVRRLLLGSEGWLCEEA